MGQQIRRHEGAVAVAADRGPVRVRHTEFRRGVDGGLGAGDDLLDERVVDGLGIGTDHRHRGPVHDRVPLREQEQVRRAADARETVRRAAHLTGGRGVVELERVGPDEQRQTLTLDVVGRQIQRGRQLDTVVALVLHQFLAESSELRVRVREARDRNACARGEVSNKVVGRLGLRLISSEDARAVVFEQPRECLVALALTPPQSFGREGLAQAHAVEKRPVPFGRRALSGQKDRPVVNVDQPPPAGVGHRDGASLVGVAVLPVSAEHESARHRWARKVIQPCSGPSLVPVVLADKGELPLCDPVDPRESILDAEHLNRLAGEGGVEREDAVAVGDLGLWVSAVERLSPDQPRVRVVLPPDASGTGGHAADGRRVAQREHGDVGDGAAGGVPDLDLSREGIERDEVRIGAPHARYQDEAPIGRGARG